MSALHLLWRKAIVALGCLLLISLFLLFANFLRSEWIRQSLAQSAESDQRLGYEAAPLPPFRLQPLPPLPNLTAQLLALPSERLERDHFPDGVCLSRGVIQGSLEVKEEEDLTLVTQTSPRHLGDVVEVTKRWDGPVSLAAFAASTSDLSLAFQLLRLVHRCRDPVRLKLTASLFFLPPPGSSSCAVNASALSFLPCFDCHECLEDLLKQAAGTQNPDWYPVNLARNLAKAAVKTERELIADAELMPSLGFVPSFQRLINSLQPAPGPRDAFVVPVYELDALVPDIPDSFADLQPLLAAKKAQPFHRRRSYECHRIPFNDRLWNSSTGEGGRLSVAASVRWQRPCWEPVFVAPHSAPAYDEVFRGYIKNKVQQVYGLCRHNFTFHILRGAFLLHRGISSLNAKEVERVGKYIGPNNAHFRAYQKELDGREGVEPLLAHTKQYCDANVKDRDGEAKPCPERYLKSRGPCCN